MRLDDKKNGSFFWSSESLPTTPSLRPVIAIHRQRLPSATNPLRVREIPEHTKRNYGQETVGTWKSSAKERSASLTCFVSPLCWELWRAQLLELLPRASFKDRKSEFRQTSEITSISPEFRDLIRRTSPNELVVDPDPEVKPQQPPITLSPWRMFLPTW